MTEFVLTQASRLEDQKPVIIEGFKYRQDASGKTTYVNINTLEELLSFADAHKSNLIIYRQDKYQPIAEIMIYDDYVE